MLLFGPGASWSAARGRETERNVRERNLTVAERITAHRTGDGDSVDVLVETWDAWTTTPEFNLESGGGELFGSVAFGERNLLGFAKAAGVAYRDDPTGISRSASFEDPNLFGSHLRLAFRAGTGSEGATNAVELGLPFYAEDAPTTFGLRWRRVTSVARLFQAASEVADFDLRLEEAEAYAGYGRRVENTIVRFTGSFLTRDRRFGPTRLGPIAPPDFAGPEENLHLRRIGGELRLWRPRPIERLHVDRLDGIEDFDLGPSLITKVGVAPRFLGSSADEGFGEVRAAGGVQAGERNFGLASFQLASRLLPSPREAVARFEARWNSQIVPRHTLALGVLGAAGARTARDYQVIVGGLNGLRAYPVHALAGTQVWRFNAESRWFLVSDYFQVVSLGAAAFYDAARAWGPGSFDLGWHHDVGFGLRLSLPHSALNRVTRFDVAFPVDPTRDGRREAVFSFGSSQAF
jgi:hypothetical protein